MKSTLILLLAAGSLGVLADEQNEFTIDCIDKIKNKYQITLNLDVKKFSVHKGKDAISEGSIAQINSSDNSIEFKLLETNTRDNKKIFTSNGLLGKLVCSV
jgi:hypothetical protein